MALRCIARTHAVSGAVNVSYEMLVCVVLSQLQWKAAVREVRLGEFG